MSTEQRSRSVLVRMLGGVVLLLAAVAAVTASPGSATTGSPLGGSSAHAIPCAPLTSFAPANFTNPTRITNTWFRLAPGAQFTFEGHSSQSGESLPHRVVFTVTDVTKMINGVRTLVLWDVDYSDDEVVEAELAFFAQDKSGNVWALGEYPEEYEEGKVAGAPDTWIAGVEDAQAGVIMRARPRVGTSSYRQGLVPSIEFGDVAKVYKTGQSNCVPVRCYQNVLVTDETNPYEPADGHQLKFYAPGVGNIRAAPRGGKEKEVLVLVDVRLLGPKGLAKVREQALKLDKRAYQVRKDLYARTPPAERRLTGGQ
jgi:hypothetical protein